MPVPTPVRSRPWVHVLLFVLTFLTTTAVGMNHYGSFLLDFVQRPLAVTDARELFFGGLWYSVTILAILGAHEMGHYLACRYYDVDASLPYFIPLPPSGPIGFLTGTLGAVIRIRAPIRTKAQLFDIGVAGPIAGFVIAVPALFWGLAMSHTAKLPPNFVGYELGEPLLLKGAAWLMHGQIQDGYSLNLHPMAFAAWFGLFATMFNLVPFGQLDGGHLVYAWLGRRARHVYVAATAATVLLCLVSMTWLLLALIMLFVLWRFGPNHPPTLDEHEPLDSARIGVALAAVLIFILCFTPAPIEPYELIGRR
jgi:membrane-associated protease RseP (regulator of RpoE activity)